MKLSDKINMVEARLDEIMDELDGKYHVSEREEVETLNGEYKDLESDLLDLQNLQSLVLLGQHFGYNEELLSLIRKISKIHDVTEMS